MSGCCQRLTRQARGTLFFGLLVSLSMILLFVGCIANNNWIPMIMIFPLMLIPIFVIMFGWMQPVSLYSDMSDSQKATENFGNCIVGVLLCSLISLPLVLLHTQAINLDNFKFWMSATGVSLVGVAVYIHYFRKRGDV